MADQPPSGAASWWSLRRVCLCLATVIFFVYIAVSGRRNFHFVLEDTPDDEGYLFKTRERYCLNQSLGGYTFNTSGRDTYISGNVTVCLVHSFSPYIEQEAAKRFLDPAHSNIYYANSPAMVWLGGELVVISRIWLDREVYESGLNGPWPENDFADNWLYSQTFDRFLRPTSEGRIMGIPSPKQFNVGDGPIEPRLFTYAGKAYATFNAAMSFNYGSFFDYTVIWDLEKNMPIIPDIQGGSPMLNTSMDIHRDKHWMPFVDKNRLYFVYNLDPFMVLTCSVEKGDCRFCHREHDSFVFDNSFSHLRGGTPFQLWQWPYFIGIAHTTLHKQTNFHRSYSAHVVLISVHPYRVVYISNDIHVHPTVYLKAPMVRAKYIDEGFIFPVSLIVESLDSLAIGVHVNDFSSVVLRLRGMAQLLHNVTRADRMRSPSRGPPVGYVQTHIHDVMENLTGFQFDHRDLNLDQIS
ncbi:hypothetical protein CAPTEDRAFT_209802 [Capitella teleta]|uniref:Uncharacterized protein n=1 Tax=Capitella teleta TaxID=283909 RepID=R7T9C6_CAPTE|nr:hypothetical protein CAPTEDRAFT_209802 [Capitella teleta]|eukprot:ELT87599.1 hypothetical protein CAPTEDRAFT_209802 [Capitella teleta]